MIQYAFICYQSQFIADKRVLLRRRLALALFLYSWQLNLFLLLGLAVVNFIGPEYQIMQFNEKDYLLKYQLNLQTMAQISEYEITTNLAMLLFYIEPVQKQQRLILCPLINLQIQMPQNVNIVVRMRPLLHFEDNPSWIVKSNSIMALQAHSTSRTNRSLSPNFKTQTVNQSKQLLHEFSFQTIISETVTSQQIYKQHIRATFLQCFQNRRNLSIMAYGQTCSGKTHTILGTKEMPGINPCILRELFFLKQSRKCRFKFSYIEIYNEKISDLLDRKADEKQLKIKQDQKWGYDIVGTVKESATFFQEAVRILEKGEKQRQYGNGQLHERSSRSHTLFRIFVEEWDQNLSSNSFVITIVDLAGSEKLVSSKQSTSETGFINKSLFQLTNVISKLSQASQHIPFRDSKLTRLLQPSLSGNGRAYLICCVSPSSGCYNETLSTLRLAERARKIQLKSYISEMKGEGLQQVKQKLRLKTKQCQQLKRQLQLLTQKLQHIQANQQKGADKKWKKCDLLILLDHQNFTLFVKDKLMEFQQNQLQIRRLKQEFMLKMQVLYEQYSREIVEICFGDQFELKIEQICFMNMILQHEKIEQYKLDIISHLIKEKEEKRIEQNEKFYAALEGYRDKLLAARSCSQTYVCRQVPTAGFTTHNDHSISNYSLNSCEQQTAKKLQSIYQQDQVCSSMLVWGSKKDYRVCKGQTYNLNIVKVSAIKNIKAIACGYHHTLVMTADGKLFGWGKNTQKQILFSERESIVTPVQIEGLKNNIKCVAAGWGHSLALTIQGQMYVWGYGKDGQLGLGTRQTAQKVTYIPFNNTIVKIYAGHSHSGFLDSLNDFYAFGFNEDYRLMIGDTRVVLAPKRVPIRDVKAAGLGVSHSALITKNGLLYCGGVGSNGELGVALDQNQSGWEQLQVADKKFQVETFEKICPIVQVEVFNQKNRAKEVRCGENSTFVLTENSQLWSFGKHLGGRLGHKKVTPQKILQKIDLIEVGCRNGLAYQKKEKKLYSWGLNLYGQTNPEIMGDVEVPQLIQSMNDKDIVTMSCGFFHSAICTK